MKKVICIFVALVMLFGIHVGAYERHIVKLGVLSKLNSTEEQFSSIWKKTFAPKNNEELDIVVKFYDSLTAMQMALNAGEIQEMVLPEATAEYMLNKNSDYQAALVLKAKGMGLAFGFRSESTKLLQQFNQALLELKGNWTFAALEGIYIASPGIDDPEPVRFEKFNGAETIKVAVTGDLPPIDFIAADGTPAGFNTAVLAEVGRYLHKNIELVNIDSGARTAALASGRADVVFWYEVDSSASVQSDVPEGVILSEPYYEWDKFIHVRKVQETKSSSDWNLKDRILDLYWPK